MIRGIIIVVVVVVAAILFAPGFWLKTAVNSAGKTVLKTDVHLDDAKISLLTGRARLSGLTIANPSGFTEPTAIKLDAVTAQVDPKSLFSKTLNIKEVSVDGLNVTYETGSGKNVPMTTSNLDVLMSNVKGDSKPAAMEASNTEAKPATAEKHGKSIVIDMLHIKNSKMTVAAGGKSGIAASFDLPDLQMKDIGKNGNADLATVIQQVSAPIMKSVKMVASGQSILKEGASGIMDKAKNMMDSMFGGGK